MGAWGTNIKDNDTSSDIYEDFFDLYNDGIEPNEISAKLIEGNKELIENPDDCNNFWFALALAQWETKSLDHVVFDKVKSIIESGNDIEVWKILEADEKDLENRKVALEKFLIKLSIEKSKRKARVKQRNVKPVFGTGDCLAFKLKNGNYGGALILATNYDPRIGYNLVVGTRINQKEKPTTKDFESAEELIKNFAKWNDEVEAKWIVPDHYEEYSDFFEIIGKIVVEKEYKTSGDEFKSYSAAWDRSIVAANLQFESENIKPKPDKSVKILDLTRQKKWWKFW